MSLAEMAEQMTNNNKQKYNYTILSNSGNKYQELLT